MQEQRWSIFANELSGQVDCSSQLSVWLDKEHWRSLACLLAIFGMLEASNASTMTHFKQDFVSEFVTQFTLELVLFTSL